MIENDHIGSFPAVLIHDVVQYALQWTTLQKELFNPAARPGIYQWVGEAIFIPFDKKVPYLLKKGKRGLVATQVAPSAIANWKKLTKVMGRRKREFVNFYL